MRKKWLICAGITLLAAILTTGMVFAANHIKLVVNDKEIKTDVPFQISKGVTVGPIRPLVEALGASIELDEKSQLLNVRNVQEIQVQQLESALAPKDKLNAASLWAESAATRNGALRYAVLSPELKEKQYSMYKELNWVIGGSSPWVESYKIVEKDGAKTDSCDYQIDYVLTDSTGAKYPAVEYITVKKINTHGFEYWFVINGNEPSYDIPSINSQK